MYVRLGDFFLVFSLVIVSSSFAMQNQFSLGKHNGKEAVLEKLKKRQEERDFHMSKQLGIRLNHAQSIRTNNNPQSVLQQDQPTLQGESVGLSKVASEKKQKNVMAVEAHKEEELLKKIQNNKQNFILDFFYAHRAILAGLSPALITAFVSSMARATAKKYRSTLPETPYEKWLVRVDKFLRKRESAHKVLAGTALSCIVAAAIADLIGHDSYVKALASKMMH